MTMSDLQPNSMNEKSVINYKIQNINDTDEPDRGVWQDEFRISYDVSGHRC